MAEQGNRPVWATAAGIAAMTAALGVVSLGFGLIGQSLTFVGIGNFVIGLGALIGLGAAAVYFFDKRA